MDKLNIGFIGGCINIQKGLPREQHYYLLLRKKINTSYLDLDIRIVLSMYKSVNTLTNTFNTFIERKNPKIIGLFIRPFTLMPLCKPLVKYETTSGDIKWGLHPCIFFSKRQWDEKLTDHGEIREFNDIKRKRIEFRDLNLFMGKILNLNTWAKNYLLEQISKIQKICAEKNIKLILISPPQNPESIMGNKICTEITKALNIYCAKNEINFIDINNISLDNFTEDLLHFNEDGHIKLCNLIFEKIVQIMN